MNNKSAFAIPEPIAQLQRRFDEVRSSRPHRAKLPETLWEPAVELARQHGLYSVTHPLRLDHVQLKKRLGGGCSTRPSNLMAYTSRHLRAPTQSGMEFLVCAVRRLGWK